ncbi:hypothetical protein SUGI_0248000 [Cryptomeria japonica]|nr:hypothetical protein SUGI_0248000 [Cryptomeria japonica]
MEAHFYLYELILSAAKPMALEEHMAEKMLSVDEIAEHIPASTKNKVPQKEYLFRILRLRLLVGSLLKTCMTQPVDKVYLDTHHHFHDAVVEGCNPFVKVYGISPWM